MEEVWRAVVGFEGLYEVSNLGDVRNAKRGDKLLKPLIQTNGKGKTLRASVCLVDKSGKKHLIKVHRLVAQAFIPNTNGYTGVIHLDKNTLNNSANNLAWENIGGKHK
jgi:hypothetical protein